MHNSSLSIAVLTLVTALQWLKKHALRAGCSLWLIPVSNLFLHIYIYFIHIYIIYIYTLIYVCNMYVICVY